MDQTAVPSITPTTASYLLKKGRRKKVVSLNAKMRGRFKQVLSNVTPPLTVCVCVERQAEAADD